MIPVFLFQPLIKNETFLITMTQFSPLLDQITLGTTGRLLFPAHIHMCVPTFLRLCCVNNTHIAFELKCLRHNIPLRPPTHHGLMIIVPPLAWTDHYTTLHDYMIPPQDIECLIQVMDPEGTGSISFDMFYQGTKSFLQGNSQYTPIIKMAIL